MSRSSRPGKLIGAVLPVGLMLAACAPAQPLGSTQTQLAAAASLVHDGGIVFAKAYPPPRLENPNLVPVFMGAAGQPIDALAARKLILLTNGQKTGLLPETDQSLVATDQSAGAFALLDTAGLVMGAGGQEGTGAAAPTDEARYALAGLDANVPFFARRATPGDKLGQDGLPTDVDLRAQMPPVRDQGVRNMGVAFATAAMLDYLALHDPTLPIKQASPQFLNWRYQIQIKSKLPAARANVWNERDTYLTPFFSLLHLDGNSTAAADRPYVPPLQGYVSEADCPYRPAQAQVPPDTNILEAARVNLGDALTQRVLDHAPLTSQGAYFYRLKTDVGTYRAALAGGQPIMLSLPVYKPDWASPDASTHYQLQEMSVAKAADTANLAYQAVVIVGYEHDENAPGGGWFIVRNSWGSQWADAGHARISFRSVMDFGYGAHIAVGYARSFASVYDVFPPPDAPEKDPNAAKPLPPITDTEAWGSYTDLTAAKEGTSIGSVPTPPVPVTAQGLPAARGHEGDAYAEGSMGFGSPAPGADGAVEPLASPPGDAPSAQPVASAAPLPGPSTDAVGSARPSSPPAASTAPAADTSSAAPSSAPVATSSTGALDPAPAASSAPAGSGH